MDITQQQVIYGAIGIAQALIMTALWFVVFVRTNHKGAWFLVPLLPIVGLLLMPFVMGAVFVRLGMGDSDPTILTVISMVFPFVFGVAPLFVLSIRLLNGRIQINRDADVFGDE